jgi:hypothetical protein
MKTIFMRTGILLIATAAGAAIAGNPKAAIWFAVVASLVIFIDVVESES